MSPSEEEKILYRNLRLAAGTTIFARGMEYVENGSVDNIRVTSTDARRISIMGTVSGTHEYAVSLDINPKTLAVKNEECDCPYNGSLCKHVAALAVAYTQDLHDDGETLSGYSTQDTNTKALVPDDDSAKKFLLDSGFPESRITPELLKTARELTSARDMLPNSFENEFEDTFLSPKVASNAMNKPFHERCFLLLAANQYTRAISFDGIYEHSPLSRRMSVYSSSVFSTPSTIGRAIINMKCVLSDAERKFVDYITDWEERTHKREPIDLIKLVQIALEANVTVQLQDSETDVCNLKSEEFRALSGELVVIPGDYAEPPSGTFRISSIAVDNDWYYAYVSASGFMMIHRSSLMITKTHHPMLARLIARAIQRDAQFEYEQKELYGTFLTEVELADLPLLVGQIREHLPESVITPDIAYAKVAHEGRGVIAIDYNRDERTILVEPSITYGVVRFPITEVLCKSYYDYDGLERVIDAEHGRDWVIRMRGETIHTAPVDNKLERRIYELRDVRGAPELTRKCTAKYRGEKQIQHFTEEVLPEWKSLSKKLGYDIVYTRNTFDYTSGQFSANFDLALTKSEDWLEFSVACKVNGEDIALEDILTYLSSGEEYLKTKDGRLLKITNKEAVERLAMLVAHFRKNAEGKLEGHIAHAPALAAEAEHSPHYTSTHSASLANFLAEAKSGKVLDVDIVIPPMFEDVLRPYQKEGYHWMHFLHSHRFGGILADDMGLGKTLQTIAFLSANIKQGKPAIVVAPKTLLSNWASELARFAPHLRVQVINGSETLRGALINNISDFDVHITSYPMIQRDIDRYTGDNISFSVCVLDEAQYIKNPRTKSAHAVKKISSDYRLALTGTPLENSVEEIWSIYDFLMPQFLGSHEHFKKHFQNPIMKRGVVDALDVLQKRIAPFMLRRTKEEVLTELPPKIEQVITCDLSDEQNILYQDVLARVKQEIETEIKKKGFANAQIHVLAGLTKLRQIANHPALILPEKARGEYPSAKLEAFLELVRTLHAEGRKVLVFSQFTSMLDILEKALTEENIPSHLLTGRTKKRGDVVAGFTDDASACVFLISTKAGGVGLNLVAADAVIIFDPWWNPSVERQAVDRAHRMGQLKSVNVYRLRTRGTIEEKIAGLQERKQKLFDGIVGESKDMFQKLTWEDVQQLLG